MQVSVILVLCMLVVCIAEYRGYTTQQNNYQILSDVKVLIFEKGKVTTRSRVTFDRPQLLCTKNCHLFEPEVVQCTNVGLDDFKEPIWKCESQFPNGIKIGKVLIVCEGLSNSQDKAKVYDTQQF